MFVRRVRMRIGSARAIFLVDPTIRPAPVAGTVAELLAAAFTSSVILVGGASIVYVALLHKSSISAVDGAGFIGIATFVFLYGLRAAEPVLLLGLLFSLQLLRLDFVRKKKAIDAYVAMKSFFTLAYQSSATLLCAAVAVGCVQIAASHISAQLESCEALYLAEFGGTLVFVSITVTVTVWKLTTAEQRFIAQATRLRDELMDAAYGLEGEVGVAEGGRLGSNGLKGVAETLNVGIHSPAHFDEGRYDTWVEQSVTTPAASRLRPISLLDLRAVKAPLKQMSTWREATRSSIRLGVFAAFVCLGLAIAGGPVNNWIGVASSVIVVAAALRSTQRFI